MSYKPKSYKSKIEELENEIKRLNSNQALINSVKKRLIGNKYIMPKFKGIFRIIDITNNTSDNDFYGKVQFIRIPSHNSFECGILTEFHIPLNEIEIANLQWLRHRRTLRRLSKAYDFTFFSYRP